jgi:hypothetical protein
MCVYGKNRFRWPSREAFVELDSFFEYCDMIAEGQNGLTRKAIP